MKEEINASGGDLRHKNKQLEGELSDVVFLTNQKDKKIQEMERTLADMRQKL